MSFMRGWKCCGACDGHDAGDDTHDGGDGDDDDICDDGNYDDGDGVNCRLRRHRWLWWPELAPKQREPSPSLEPKKETSAYRHFLWILGLWGDRRPCMGRRGTEHLTTHQPTSSLLFRSNRNASLAVL